MTATEQKNAPAAASVGGSPRLRPLWPGWNFIAWAVAVAVAARAISAVFIQWMAVSYQDPSIYSGEHPRYYEFAGLWDGVWYQRIVDGGYPDVPPRDEQGRIVENPWAFYPMFPLMVRGLMAVTGGSFTVIAPLLATLLGLVAAVLMAVLLRRRLGSTIALCAVWVWACMPAAPSMQVAYTESLAMLLLCAFLLAIDDKRWWWAALFALATGLARPIALPLGLVALVVVICRWCERKDRPIVGGEYAGMAAALVSCGLSGLMWPAYAWYRTGSWSTYTETMQAWRSFEEIKPFEPWIPMAEFLFGPTQGPVYLALVIALLVLMVVGPWARALGPAMRTWSLAYPFYLGAVLMPWTSIYRYLVPLFPLCVVMVGGGWLAGQGGRNPKWLIITRAVVFSVILLGWQVWWLWELFRFEPPSDNPP